jgi:uncharacterized protein with PQ loop repeat
MSAPATTPAPAHTTNSSEDKMSQMHEYWTHQIFPARTKLKDLAYWVTELYAAIYLLLLILGMGLEESSTKTSADGDFTVMTLKDSANNLMNCEFGWIILAYCLKYLIYIIDTIMMISKKRSTAVDLVPVVLNFIVWVIWTLYAFLCTQDEIWSGVSYRYSKDQLNYKVSKANPAPTQDQYDAALKPLLENYDNKQTGTWIWIPCLIAAIANLACWVMGMAQKRSTLFTNAAISTWLIPLQLFFFNLFLKGSWFKSSYQTIEDDKANNWTNGVPPNANAARKSGEFFDARYIFIVIYFGSWFCLAFAIPNFMRFLKEVGQESKRLAAIRYGLYAVFFISNFIWCLWMDATYLERYITGYGILVVSGIVSIIVAFAIAVTSLIEKFKEDENVYFDRHSQAMVKPQ